MIKDGDWVLFNFDKETGRTVWMLEDNGMTHFRIDYPVDKLIEANAIQRDLSQDNWKGDYHHIASIPLNMVHDEKLGLLKASEQGDDKYLSRFLNDSDNRAWRTKNGKV